MKLVSTGQITIVDSNDYYPQLNLLDWLKEWTVGSDVLPNWGNNGLVSENSRVYQPNPFGVQSLMWKCAPTGTNDADGGWTTSTKVLDKNYAHRYCCFVYKTKVGGSTFMGCNGVNNIADNTPNSNPYFIGGITNNTSNFKAGEWYLMVGIIHPNSITAQSGISGLYDLKGNKVGSGTDFKFRTDGTNVNFRTFLYYSFDNTPIQYLYNPLLHRLDGTEPTIEQILQTSIREQVDLAKTALETSIEETNEQIALRATKITTDALGNRLSTAESSIVTNAEQIALRVEKDGIVSAINQTAETIKISASKVELEGAVNFSSLTQSAKDTIINSSVNLFNFSTWYANTFIIANGTMGLKGRYGLTMTSTAADCYTNTYLSTLFRWRVSPSTTYTFSFKKANSTTGTFYIFYYADGVTGSYLSATSIGATSLTFTTPAACNFISIRFGISAPGLTETFSDIMLVKGSVPVAFTASTIDLDYYSNSAQIFAENLKTDLQTQIDGNIISWFRTVDALMTNSPAVEWNTETLRNQHANDTYTNTSNGKCWRFQYTGSWGWGVISDTATQQALTAAGNAQTTANGKCTTFGVQPTTAQAYQIGDLWMNATVGAYTNELLKCITAKATGVAFNVAHWTLASKYTDDTTALAAKQKAEEAYANIGGRNLMSQTPVTQIIVDQNPGNFIELNKEAGVTSKAHKLTNATGAGVYRFKVTYDTPTRSLGWYTVSFKYKHTGGGVLNANVLYDNNSFGTIYKATVENTWKTFTGSVFISQYPTIQGSLDLNVLGSNWFYLLISDLKVEKGQVATPWNPALEDLKSAKLITDAIGSSSSVNGGLFLTTLMELREAETAAITAGISGMQGSNKDLPMLWGNGTYEDAIANLASTIFKHNGDFRLADGQMTYDAINKLIVSCLYRTAASGARIEMSPESSSITILDLLNVARVKIHPKTVTPFAQIGNNMTTVETTYASHSGIQEVGGTSTIGSTEILHLDAAKFYNISTPVVAYDLEAIGAYDSLTKIHYYGSATITVQLVDTIKNVIIWSRSQSASSGTSTVDSKTGSIPSSTIAAQYGSDYRIEVLLTVASDGNGSMGTAQGSIAAGAKLSALTLTGLSEIGLDGFNFINDISHYFHYGPDGMKYNGVSDMPGVLATGSVNSSTMTHINKWGAKVGLGTRPITKNVGYVTVPHEVGNAAYTVQITPTTDNVNIRLYGSKGTNSFTVIIRDANGSETVGSFDYTIHGAN